MSGNAISHRLTTLFPALEPADARVALSIYRLLAGDVEVNPRNIAIESGEAETHVRYLLNNWPGVFRDENMDIVGFWGLARPEMHYELRIAGQRRFAWCAWDTLFVPELLNVEVRVQATTGMAHRPIRLTVSPDGVLRETPFDDDIFVSFNLPTGENWEDNVAATFCHHVHFLYTDEVPLWQEQNVEGVVLPLRQAFEVGKLKNRHQFSSAMVFGETGT